jgi:hypothetical protein
MYDEPFLCNRHIDHNPRIERRRAGLVSRSGGAFPRRRGRLHLFAQVRTDLEHVWEGRARDKERDRLQKTEEELTKMQADLDQTRWDNGLLNDVIDSIRKSSNDQRLPARDRDILADDLHG